MAPASKIYPALTLEVMVSRKEGQYYDVKSAQKKPSELSDIVSAYANAEGGTVVIGISDKTRRVEVVNAQGEEKINISSIFRRTAAFLCRNTATSSWT